MPKRISILAVVVGMFLLAAMFWVSQTSATNNYYSNNFDSASALEDGYWSLHNAAIQTVDGSSVLGVDGDAPNLHSVRVSL